MIRKKYNFLFVMAFGCLVAPLFGAEEGMNTEQEVTQMSETEGMPATTEPTPPAAAEAPAECPCAKKLLLGQSAATTAEQSIPTSEESLEENITAPSDEMGQMEYPENEDTPVVSDEELVNLQEDPAEKYQTAAEEVPFE